MSLFELLMIMLVSFLVLKPEDIPHFARKLQEIRSFVTKAKMEVITYINSATGQEVADLKEDMEQMNFYLEKIASIGSSYTGDYALQPIKDHYTKLVQKELAIAKIVDRQS